MSEHFDKIFQGLQCDKKGCACHNRGTARAKVHCPFHGDDAPSFSISEINGRVLFHCHAGCKQRDVLEALVHRGLWNADTDNTGSTKGATPTQTRFEIRDVRGELVATHVREDLAGRKKLWWETPDGTTGLKGRPVSSLPLFGSELLGSGEINQSGVVLTEGEKAAKSLQEKGKRALGTVCGASVTPDDEVLKILVPHYVVLWPDSDIPGMEHMTRIGDALLRMGANEVHVVDWPDAPHSGDAADYTGDLDTLLMESPVYVTGAQLKVNDPEPIPTLAILGKQVLEEMQSEYKESRISYGFEELDKATGGQRSNTMTVIGGRTSEGKSTLLMQLAECASLKGPALILSNEMGGIDFYIRALAFHSHIPMQVFRDQEKIDDVELPQVFKAMAHLSQLPLAIYDNVVTVDEVVERIERVQREMGPVAWVGIDWLQMLDAPKVRSGRTEQLDAITRGIRRIASDFRIPVTLVVQYDKKTAFGEEAVVESVRGTALPGMLCDVFIMLNRKGDKTPGGYQVELKLGKNRQGPLIEKMPLWFDSEHVRFLKVPGKVEI